MAPPLSVGSLREVAILVALRPLWHAWGDFLHAREMRSSREDSGDGSFELAAHNDAKVLFGPIACLLIIRNGIND